jgi:hypothetical protein
MPLAVAVDPPERGVDGKAEPLLDDVEPVQMEVDRPECREDLIGFDLLLEQPGAERGAVEQGGELADALQQAPRGAAPNRGRSSPAFARPTHCWAKAAKPSSRESR